MAIACPGVCRVEAGDVGAGRLRVNYSSYLEMLLSLDLLYAPQAHGVLHPWVVRLKEKVPRRFHDEISAFGDIMGGWLPLARLALRLEPGDLAATTLLERIETVPDGQFCELLAESPDQVGAARLESAALPNWRRRLSAFLSDYWTAIFREEFYWIEPLLQRSVQEVGRRAEREEARALIDELTKGRIEVDPADFASITAFPSVFGTPDHVVDLWDGRLALTYAVSPVGAMPRDELAPPEVLSRMLKALGDESRLKIMKLILDRRRCTQELAAELELSEPTVSKHLKILREAELLTAAKEGNYVYYSLRLERIAELQMRILDFLRS